MPSRLLTPWRAGLLAGVGVLIFFSIAANSQKYGWLSWYQLSTTGKEVAGTVTRVEPEVHQRCHFEYAVDGAIYKGWDDGCSSLKVGGGVTVRYLPADPAFAVAASRDPGEHVAFLILATLLMSVIAGVAVAWRVARRQRAEPPYPP